MIHPKRVKLSLRKVAEMFVWWAGLSESFEIDGLVVNVSSQSRDILFKKMPFIKKCKAE